MTSLPDALEVLSDGKEGAIGNPIARAVLIAAEAICMMMDSMMDQQEQLHPQRRISQC